MSLIADGILIVACLTTAVYCFVLSRRLRSLSQTEDGLGLQLLQLNTALDETRASVKEIRSSAKTATDRLSREIAQSKRVADRLKRVLAEVESKTATATQRLASQAHDRSNADMDDDDGDEESLRSEAEDDAFENLGDISESALSDLDLDEEAQVEDPDDDVTAFLEDSQDEMTHAEAGDQPDDGESSAETEGEPSEQLLKVERVAL